MARLTLLKSKKYEDELVQEIEVSKILDSE